MSLSIPVWDTLKILANMMKIGILSFGFLSPYAWNLTIFFLIFYLFFVVVLQFYFIFKLYIIVLVLPNIKMNPPQVYMCSPSWTLLPPPSPFHSSGSSQCTSPKHPVSCIVPGLATRFIHDILHFSIDRLLVGTLRLFLLCVNLFYVFLNVFYVLEVTDISGSLFFLAFDFVCLIFWSMKFYFYVFEYLIFTSYVFGVSLRMSLSPQV